MEDIYKLSSYAKETVQEIFASFLNYDLRSTISDSLIRAVFKGEPDAILKELSIDVEEYKQRIYVKKEVPYDYVLNMLLFAGFYHERRKALIKKHSIIEHINIYIDFLFKLKSLAEQYMRTQDIEIINRLPKSKIQMEINYKVVNGQLKHTLNFKALEDLVMFGLISYASDKSVNINICQNCGKFFIPKSRSDEVYCDNIFDGGKTCKQVGYGRKINNDAFKKAYRRAYKTQNARKNRNIKNCPTAEEDFRRWARQAKDKLNEARNGEITLEEFEEWLKEG